MISGISTQNLIYPKYLTHNRTNSITQRSIQFKNSSVDEVTDDKKINKQKRNALLVSLLSVAAILSVVLIKKHKSPKDVTDDITSFLAVKDDEWGEIPTVENCKSLNKKLKKIIEQRLNLNNADEDILAEVGKSSKNTQHMILWGPSGVGKSYFAKVYAKSIGAEYDEILYSEVNSRWVGEEIEKLENKLGSYLNRAKNNPDKNYVFVINEMDAFIIPPENLSSVQGSTHWVTVLRQRSVFLNYMEKMQNEAPNITVIGTTNIKPKNNDRAAISRMLPIKVDMPEADCLYEAEVAKILTFKNGEQIVKDNEKQLRKISKDMQDRKFSYRDLNKVHEAAVQMHIDARVGGAKGDFKVGYLEESLKNFEFTDGELAAA